jgi:hypothetical protein
MSPRVIQSKRCPHCKAELPQPTPRVCPSCAGSLQKRFLTLGCLTSAPPVVLALLGAAWALRDTAEATANASAVERADHRVPEHYARPDAHRRPPAR